METMAKKDREKKKQKKKQDKMDKKANRKDSNDKGKSLEDMMVYLDENGNLSPTPPDPRRMKAIDADSIQIGIPRKEDMPAEETLRTGKVRFFDKTKGYGFIDDAANRDSIFVHQNGLTEEIREGDKVSFETEKTAKGLNAVKVKRIV
ncbi:DNA-binding protein [Chitinophagaceae bacterium IBVUCB1]|nr:DNA-binding protein [Chitinophagaceae bacterium IBVUCB1]